MAEMLSQDEINALLGGMTSQAVEEPEHSGNSTSAEDALTSEEKDILGEIGNISMGTAATTLSALLNQKVVITTPVVNIYTWDQISALYVRPCVGVRIDYTVGLRGTNILILVNKDVKIITNLMMGGDGLIDESDIELSELDLSAIGEAMNQMIGSSSTSLASMMNEKIDIATPNAFQIDFSEDNFFDNFAGGRDEQVVAISFNLQIGTLVDSTIVQALPIDFAKQMALKLKTEFTSAASVETSADKSAPASVSPPAQPAPQAPPAPAYQEPVHQAPAPPQAPPPVYPDPAAYQAPQAAYPAPPPYQGPPPGYPDPAAAAYQSPPPMYYDPNAYYAQPPKPAREPQLVSPVNAQPVQFASFDFESAKQQKENIDILMDVPLEVTVELGKTAKKIKDILEFAPGTIIELDKLAGEPIDIMVNGKYVAKGEVVVIEENFAIRITSIINSELRI